MSFQEDFPWLIVLSPFVQQALLGGEHHRALHDGEFGIVALGKQRFRFHESDWDGTPLEVPGERSGGTSSHPSTGAPPA